MAGRVQDKVTIITGAGSGIGEACMELFAREGAIVIGCGRRTDVLDKVLKKVTDAGGRGMVVQADLSDEKQAQNVVDETLKAYGPHLLFGERRGHQYDARDGNNVRQTRCACELCVSGLYRYTDDRRCYGYVR